MIKLSNAKAGSSVPDVHQEMGKRMDQGEHVVYFYRDACGACKAMTPIIDKMVERDSRFQKVDTDRMMGVTRKFGVMVTPTTIFIKNGIIEKMIPGALRPTKIEALLAEWKESSTS